MGITGIVLIIMTISAGVVLIIMTTRTFTNKSKDKEKMKQYFVSGTELFKKYSSINTPESFSLGLLIVVIMGLVINLIVGL